MKLLCVSPCFYPDTKPAELLLRSAEAYEVRLALYGVGQPFIPHGADAQVAKLWELLMNNRKSGYTHVLVTDAIDTLFLTGVEEIVHKYQRWFRAPLVMSAEREFWPPQEGFKPETHFPPVPYGESRYLNAGQHIGDYNYTLYCLRHLLERYRANHTGYDNSQPWWALALARREIYFDIDTRSILFQSMSGGADADVKEVRFFDGGLSRRRLYNTQTETHPAMVHFNGRTGVDGAYEAMYRRLFEEGS